MPGTGSYSNDNSSPSLWRKIVDYPYGQTLKSLFLETKIEILIGAIAFGTVGGIASYNANKHKRGEIPVAFSEYESIQEEFNKKGERVPALTTFYAVTNDIAMKVFESNNLAYQHSNGDHKAFAYELRTRVNPAYKNHALISEYADSFPNYTNEALQSLSAPITAAQSIPGVKDAFNKTWGYDYHHNYHTEYYTERECTGTGKDERCYDVTKSREVYDNTDHYYTYHREFGEQADILLSSLMQKYPDMRLTESLRRASTTHEENQNAIRKSMRELFEKKNPDAEDYLKLANKWADGSTFEKNYPAVREAYAKLSSISRDWSSAKTTAKSISYRTNYRSDDGPAEYQLAETAQGNCNRMTESLYEIIDGINFAGQKVPELNSKIKEYVGVVLEGKPGNADDLRAEILETTKSIYQKNFKDGYDVNPNIWGWVVLFSVLGIAAGAAAGTGVDKILPSALGTIEEHLEKRRQRKEQEAAQKQKDEQAKIEQQKLREAQEKEKQRLADLDLVRRKPTNNSGPGANING